MLYHLSISKNLLSLTPKVPEIAVPLYEDVITPRICFSDNIEGCLSALQDKPQKYYVYIPDEKLNEVDIYYPSAREVRDCKFTNEVWIKKEIKVKCIGIIQSQSYDWSKRHNTGYGSTTYFHYPYKWIK